MKYQKIANLLDNEVGLTESNEPSKFRTRNWVEIKDVEIATRKKRYISLEERKQIFEELRLVPKNYV